MRNGKNSGENPARSRCSPHVWQFAADTRRPDDPVDSAQGRHLGGALLKDAILRTLAIAENAGVRALLVHAMHQPAKAFYLHHGFEQSPIDPMTLMLRLPKPDKSESSARE